jgi:ribonuclease P protein component
VKQGERAERILGRARFGRTRRVRSSRDFQRVRRQGRHVSGALVTVGYARRDQPDALARVGFSVSKRVGGAVQRNRVKRRLREIVRRLLVELPAGDVIVTAKPGARAATDDDLAAELRALLVRSGLLRAETGETHRGDG